MYKSLIQRSAHAHVWKNTRFFHQHTVIGITARTCKLINHSKQSLLGIGSFMPNKLPILLKKEKKEFDIQIVTIALVKLRIFLVSDKASHIFKLLQNSEHCCTLCFHILDRASTSFPYSKRTTVFESTIASYKSKTILLILTLSHFMYILLLLA